MYIICHLQMYHVYLLFILLQKNTKNLLDSPAQHNSSMSATAGQPHHGMSIQIQSPSESRLPASVKKARVSIAMVSETSLQALQAKRPSRVPMRNTQTHPDAHTAHEAKILLECTVLPRMKQVRLCTLLCLCVFISWYDVVL